MAHSSQQHGVASAAGCRVESGGWWFAHFVGVETIDNYLRVMNRAKKTTMTGEKNYSRTSFRWDFSPGKEESSRGFPN